MFFPLVGIVAVGVAVAASRRRDVAPGGLGSAGPGVHTAESLAATQRAARKLYEPVDQKRPIRSDLLLEDDAYAPSCEVFSEDVQAAMEQATAAEDMGEPEAYSAKVAAVQAWALSQIECEGDTSLETQAERPLYLV